MQVEERKRKIEKFVEGIREQLEHEPMIFDERFTGELHIVFNIQSGGISGNISSTRKGKLILT